MIDVITGSLYLAVSIATTLWLARNLNKNGRRILIEAPDRNEALAAAVCHSVVVGFWLVSIGYVMLTLRFADWPTDVSNAITYLGTKIGFGLVILGIVHFFSISLIARFRLRALIRTPETINPTGAAAQRNNIDRDQVRDAGI